MPPISPMPPDMADWGSGTSVMRASVVRIIAAIEAAFCTALPVTLAGSIMPDASRLQRHGDASATVFSFSVVKPGLRDDSSKKI